MTDTLLPGARATSTQIPSWILSSAGASALLVTFGYLAEAARDHLLGVRIRENVALAEYGLAGARFVVNVITLVFRWIGLHPVVAGVLTLIVAAIAIITVRGSHKTISARGILVRLAVILLLLLTKAAFIDVPAALIENVLIERTDPKRTFDAAPVLDWRTRQLWRTLICAHATRTADANIDCGPSGGAARTLEGTFLINVFVTTLLIVMARNLFARTEASSQAWQSIMITTRMFTWTALSVAVVALPYHYGKLVAPTLFSEAIVNFKAVDTRLERKLVRTDLAPLPIDGSAQPTPPSTISADGSLPHTDTAEDPETVDTRARLSQPALLLTANASVLTLYYPSDDLVRELSRTDVDSITLYPPRDVLQIHMDRCIQK